MVVVARPFRFEESDPRPMLRHLDSWARRRLSTPEGWGSALEVCSQWSDYSARNQVLLASYGVVGVVAGGATWERVPSTEPGRGCAVRSGEHGLPVRVRVPVVDVAAVGSERSRHGARSGSVPGSHRWEPVFALEQLARRPATDALANPAVPEWSAREWCEVVRQASGRLLGRTPRRIVDPAEKLRALVGSVPLGSGRTRLSAELAAQAEWVVTDRVGRAERPLPRFDPVGCSARERWRTMVDVRHAAGRVLEAVSFAAGVELCRSPLPRHEAIDDRVVSPGRRNYLAPADVRALPLVVWVEVGPYSRAEWLARGVAGAAGVASFLRVNDRSYLAAYETRSGARWRLETTGRGAHQGLVGEGDADDLAAAKDAARSALAERFPNAAVAVETGSGSRVVSSGLGWAPLAQSRDGRSEQRAFDDRVSAMVSPGPGGRWQTWTVVDGQPRQGPLTADVASAKAAADELAHGALLELASVTPERANALVAEWADHRGSWSRERLVTVVGHRLTDDDRAELSAAKDPDRLVELLGSVGVLAPATLVRVLHAEGVDLDGVLGVADRIGLPVPEFVREVHDRWGADRLELGRAIGATTEELRAAGCSPTELLAAAPREELRRLDARERTWELAAAALVEAGYSAADTVAHLAAHAPTPANFAVGVRTVIESPVEGFALAAGRAAVEDLVALSERYELSPADTAATLAAAAVPAQRAVPALAARCGHDPEHTIELAALMGAAPAEVETLLVDAIGVSEPDLVGGLPMFAIEADQPSVVTGGLDGLRRALDQASADASLADGVATEAQPRPEMAP